ncbi:MAG: hypothetical protein KDB21_00810 [Acidimicrobiales bacterium]|nr:hypothetical protein [Acidimicrobiales bacterium]
MTTADGPSTERANPPLRNRLHPHRDLVSGSLWVVVSVGIHALSGFVFWLVAARLGDADLVGQATALFTASLFVSYATSLGLPVAIARFAPDDSDRSRDVFAHAVRATWLGAALGAGIMVAAVPASVRAPLGEIGMPLGIAVFVVVTAGIGLATLVDVRWMTLRSWRLVVWRVSLLGVVRLALVPIGDDPLWLFVLVAGAVSLSGYLGVAVICGRRLLARIERPDGVRALVRYSAVHYLGSVAVQGPTFAVPLIVLLIVPSADNAVFYVVWGIGANLNLIPHVIGQALLAEGGKSERTIASQTKVALALAAGLMIAGAAVLVVARDLVASLYGDGYEQAGTLVAILVMASIPWAVTAIALTRARVEDRSVLSSIITVSYAAGTIGATIVATRARGIRGAADAWLWANVAVAVIAIGALALMHREQRRAAAALPADAASSVGAILDVDGVSA